MRTLLLTILGCLAFTAGHAGAAQNPAPETAGAQQDAKARGAHLRMEVAGHDFGDVPRKGGDLVREFTFTNDGTAPLVVTRVITSCSCLKASFPKRPVPPGGQGVIRITYEPHKSEPGVFNKVIQVYSNSVDGRDVITGLPKTVRIESEEIRRALNKPLDEMAKAVKDALDATPPDLASDLMYYGILLTGGGALLRGLDVRLRDETGVSVNVSPTALDNVVNGCARVLEANAFDGGFVQTNA